MTDESYQTQDANGVTTSVKNSLIRQTEMVYKKTSSDDAAALDMQPPAGMTVPIIMKKALESLPLVIGLGSYLFIVYLSLL